MIRWRKIAVLWLLLFSGAQLFAASPAERRAFNVAAEAFGFSSWAYAETNFARFTQKFPESELFAEAVLFQARARFNLGQYDRAIALLSANQSRAGAWADQYLLWMAEAQLAGGRVESAADSFARLVENFPASTNRLRATVREAEARAKLQQWSRVIASLQKPDGAFQQAIKSGATDALGATGYLILGEAQLAEKDFAGTKRTLEWLAGQELNSAPAWRRSYLEIRLQLAEDHVTEALESTTNLVAKAIAASDADFQAESIATQAEVFERLGRLDEAINAHKKNMAPLVPAGKQRAAILKVAALSLAQNKIADAVQTLTTFLEQHTNSAATDVALLTLGELHLKQFAADAPATNLLNRAEEDFDRLLRDFPNSSLAGKAWLNKGWCQWLRDRFAESGEAFQAAAARLPFSEEQAVARFKWADSQFRLKDFAGAITNYHAFVEKFTALPAVKEQLVELALYQTVRAALEAGDLGAATNALEKILTWYPQGFAGDRSLLLTGQEFSREQNPERARELFARFQEMYPTNPLAFEVRLALARSYEQEKNWDAAITNYDAWLGSVTNHAETPLAELALVEFSRAQAHYFIPGHETNAFLLFTNFVGRFRTNQLTLQAQYWIGDYYFGHGDWTGAEMSYQLVFKNTNWPPSEVTYQARMMAGRAAVARQGYKDAMNYYFSPLAGDTNCPLQLRLQATFACGDAQMSRTDSDATNHQAELNEAVRWFRSIAENYPTNDLAPPAWGRIGDCYLQLAATGTNVLYDLAANAYQQALNLPQASVATRAQAKVGLGMVAEKQARLKTGEEQAALLTQALTDYHDVFLGKDLREGEPHDLFWIKEAGLKALRVASEDLNDWQMAFGICTNLAEKFPQLRSTFEGKAIKLKESLVSGKK